MQTKSLLIIILKVLGLLLIKDFLPMIPQVLSLVPIFLTSTGDYFLPFFSAIISIGLYAWLSYMFLMKTEWVVNKLKLMEGLHEDTLSFNLHRFSILHISVIVVGLLMVLQTLPYLIRQLFLYFQYKREQAGFFNQNPEPDFTYLIVQLTTVLMGLLMVYNARQIVSFIELQRR